MKKVQSIIVFIALAVVLSAFTSAVTAPCTLSVSMVNQDPYPAVPDEYVKTVFQMNGADNSDCGKVFMRIVPQYPFSLDSNDSTVFMDSTFVSGYSSYLLAAYKLRVDKDVLDGENKIKIEYGKVDDLPNVLTKEFNIEVEDARTDFEVLIQDYTVATNSVTFAVVNIGKKDVEALTLEIPKQTNIEVKGSNKAIIGSLNSNDDTTISLSAIPMSGDIVVRLYYNDQVGVRRMVEKTIAFTDGFLTNGKNVKKEVSNYVYLFWGLIAIIIIYNIYSHFKRKAKMREKLFMRNLK